MHRALLGLLVVIVITVVTVGALVVILLAMSDICYDPDSLIKGYAPSSISDLINYYLSCDDSCENPFSMDLVTRSENRTIQVVSYIVEHVQDEFSLAALDIAINNLNTSLNIARNVSQLLNCTTVHQHYLSMQTMLCKNAMSDAVVEFSLLTILAICGITFFTCGCIGSFQKRYKDRLIKSGSSLFASYQAFNDHPSKWKDAI